MRLERAGDLVGEAFLHLQPPREDVDDVRELRQSDDPPGGDARDVRAADDRELVVLAE